MILGGSTGCCLSLTNSRLLSSFERHSPCSKVYMKVVLASPLGLHIQFKTTMADTEIDSFTEWSDLPKELLDLILSKMSSISIYNFRAVCSSWRSAAKAYIASPSCSMLHEVPWLMLPPEQENDNKMSFYNLDEKRVYKSMGRPKEFDNSLCLGSSHGWLVMLDEKSDPYLFNPFTLAQIQLPLIATYPDVFCVYKSGNDDGYDIEFTIDSPGRVGVQTFDSVHRLRRDFIRKAVLSSDPSHNDFFVLMIFVFGSFFSTQLAFCHSGDSNWVRLGEMSNWYADVICYKDKFTAGDVVEFWEIIDSSPVKASELRVAERPESSVSLPGWDLLFRNYLVESSGDLLLIERFVNCFNLEIRKSLFFRIFKLNFTTKEWEEVESLGDCVLFLGGNQSKSVSIPGNSIYFTDDDWDRLYDYRIDYDVGVFSVEDKSIKSFYQSGIPQRTEPPPFWIDPISLLVA